ncbi:MAG TPA: class I SAM-dependent methyltransferase [Solirubrobacteraceae bacterium]|nr:class I SAM-dependent methyltransferase [Solirubrobacteraceae bacterium]
MAIANEPCRVCGAATSPMLTARDRNREVDDREFGYVRCDACATIQLSDVPRDLGPYYDDGYHGVPAPADLRARLPLEAHKIDLLATHVEPGRLVEIGPSFGAFALAAREAGYDVTGIEMDPACCAYLEGTVGVRAIQSSRSQEVLAELPPSRVIAMWHVLEHLEHPVQVLEAAAANLEPGGVLAIAVPNPQSLGFAVMRRRWAHLDAPRHLTLLPLATLVAQARGLGLEHVATRTADPFARHCNRFAWEYALRRRPASGPSPLTVVLASHAVERLMAPVERRGLRSAAYTVLLRRPASTSSTPRGAGGS